MSEKTVEWPAYADMLLELVGKRRLDWVEVAEQLNRAGHTTKKGCRFAANIVARMYPKLMRERKRHQWRESKRASYRTAKRAKETVDKEMVAINRVLAETAMVPAKTLVSVTPLENETTEAFVTRTVLDLAESLQAHGIHLSQVLVRPEGVKIAYHRVIETGSGAVSL